MSTGLILLCAVTIGVFATVYQLSDEPLPADQPSVANPTGSRAVPTLQFVITVSRHGNRAPLVTYPKNPYPCNDTKIWPYGVGELSQVGRVQMYNLGKKFRSLYNGFLEEIYHSRDFQALSTVKGRTIQSAEVFLAGLFPPTGFQVWNKHLLWQPIPIFPNLLDHEYIVFPYGPNVCPKFREAQRISVDIMEQEVDSEIEKIFEYVLPYTGFDADQFDRTSKQSGNMTKSMVLFYVWESLIHPYMEGLTLPDWSKTIFPEPLTSLITRMGQGMVIGSEPQIRYLEGEMFKEIVGRMQAKEEDTLKSARHMVYYSGHDHTILGLKGILGLDKTDLGYVNPGSALILEIHEDPANGRFYIQVLYIDGASKDLEPTNINIPSCDSPCDLHLLLNITEKYYNITDWREECHNYISV